MVTSVVVPAFNAEGTLGACLRAVRESTIKNYELIVVDDGSTDSTSNLASSFTDRVVSHPVNQGRSHARQTGIRTAKGEILVFIDSDVVIQPETLSRITEFFSLHEEIDALTGLLGKEHPHRNFFSQYKNLYMHYTFNKLPGRVNFLYGSIFAIRRRALVSYDHDVPVADDTAFGQKLISEGRQIAFLRELEVVHLKKYRFASWLKNDFRIPFDWAQIFVRYQGWRQLGKHRTGYLHAPREQLVSVVLAPAILLLGFSAFSKPGPLPLLTFIGLWLFLNIPFLRFLTRQRGALFGIRSVFATFFDHLVMAAGITCGLVKASLRL